MRYQTGNPVEPDGSNDPRDLYDNSAIIDTWANDRSKRSSPDRLGVERMTWHGMEQQVNDFLASQGFEALPLDYIDGSLLIVDRPTQLIQRGDNLYSVKLPASFPLSLSGTWSADQSLLVVQVDQGFKQELGGGVRRINSVSELRTIAGRFQHDAAQTVGYHATLPGFGSALYRWDQASTAQDNGGTVIAPTGSSVGRWMAATGECIDVALFGAQQGQDFSAALAAAAVWCKSSGQKLVGSGRYNMSAVTVNLRYLSVDLGAAYITMADGAQIVLGNRSNTPEAPRQELGIVRVPTPGNAQVTTVPTVKVVGAKGQDITIASTNWLQLYASVAVPEDASLAYSTFHLGDLARLDMATDPAFPTGIQWINENTINVKRIYNVLAITGSYSHNHNLINTGTFEEGAVIYLNTGNNNLFMAERFENGPIAITLSQGTFSNVIENTWHGNQLSQYDPVNRNVNVEDFGEGNMVLRNTDYTMRHSEVLTLNSRTCRSFSRVAANVTSLRGCYASAHGLDTFEITDSFQVLLDTGKIPVRINDGFQAIMDGTKMRCRWMIYDTAGKEMTAVAGSTLLRTDGGTAPIGGNVYSQGGGIANSFVSVRSSTVGYLRCQVYANGAPAMNQLFKHIGVIAMTQHREKDGPQRVNCMGNRTPAAAAKPAIGWAEPGDVVQSTTVAATRWLCTFSLSTSLASAMAASATVISPVTGTGTAAGDVVGIQLDNGKWHWTTLASPGSLSVGVPSAASSGGPVVFVRWA